MKILMICDFFNPNQLYQENLLTKYYQKKGHEVVIIASKYDSIIDYYQQKSVYNINTSTSVVDNIKIIRLNYSINLFNKVRLLKGIPDKLKNEKPDVIYVHGIPLNLIPSSRYKKKNIETQLIFDTHADYGNSGTNWISLNILHRLFYRIILKRQLQYIDNFFFVSPRGGDFVRNIYNIPESYTNFLPLGADSDYIDYIKTKYSVEDIKKELGIISKSFVIFTGGKLQSAKKTELVIDAVNKLNNKEIYLIIIGKSLDENYYQYLIKAANKNTNILFLGWLQPEEIYKYLHVSDIAVFPSSTSVLWQQSIATGLPVIIGDEFGNADYLNKNNNAFILKSSPKTSLEISLLIKSLVKDRDKLNEMKNGAIKTLKEFLSYEKISDNSLKYNKKIL